MVWYGASGGRESTNKVQKGDDEREGERDLNGECVGRRERGKKERKSDGGEERWRERRREGIEVCLLA
jgi:hypothetical protein